MKAYPSMFMMASQSGINHHGHHDGSKLLVKRACGVAFIENGDWVGAIETIASQLNSYAGPSCTLCTGSKLCVGT
jgi:hypothetical protein